MKTHFLIVLSLSLFSLCLVHAQDNQWYIKNGAGCNSSAGSVNHQFHISNLAYPCTSCHAYARKDILVIYQNGEHYNSRNKPSLINSPIFGPTSPHYNFNFKSLYTSSAIKYLYLTNIYQGDDPPEMVGVNNCTSPCSNPFDFSTTTPVRRITANHDIVKGKDITLILKLDGVALPCTLKMHRLIRNVTTYPESIVPNCFTKSTVFQTNFTYGGYLITEPASSDLSELIISNINTKFNSNYLYVNLKPSAILNNGNYFPDEANVVKYKMAFELFSNMNTMIDSLQEELRDSHDPNFIRVEKICRKSSGEQFVFYHAQFQNTSLQPQNKLKIGFKLPDILDKNCITIQEWGVGNSIFTDWVNYQVGGSRNNKMTVHVHTSLPQQTLQGMKPVKKKTPTIPSMSFVTFEFDPNKSVQMCDNSTDHQSIGWIKFCVKVKNDTLDLTKASISLEPTQRHTKFGTTHYAIHDFFDKCIKRDSSSCQREYQDSNCSCACRR